MLKKLRLGFAGLIAATSLVVAGDCSTSSCGNACPLAKEAATRVSNGGEAIVSSRIARRDFVDSVLRNLEAI